MSAVKWTRPRPPLPPPPEPPVRPPAPPSPVTAARLVEAAIRAHLADEHEGGTDPSAHADTHQHGGDDEVATTTPAAFAIPKAGAGGTLGTGWIPDLSAVYAPLAHNHDATYAPIASGVTNGDSHDHSGGDGAQIPLASGVSGDLPFANLVPAVTGASVVARVAASAGDYGELALGADTLVGRIGTDPLSAIPLTEHGRDLIGAASAADQRLALSLVPGTHIMAYSANLASLEGMAGAGLVAHTAAGTFSPRTLTAPAAGITVTNGDGVSGNPTLALANDLAALEALGNGIPARTGIDTWAARTLQAPAAGLTITNPAGAAGDPTFALSHDLAGLEGMTGTGLAVRTGTSTWDERTITASTGISVTFGDGVLGNPTIAVDSTVYRSGSTDVAVADGGSGASTAAGALTNFGIVRAKPSGDKAMAGGFNTGTVILTLTLAAGVQYDLSGFVRYAVPGGHGSQIYYTTTGTVTFYIWRRANNDDAPTDAYDTVGSVTGFAADASARWDPIQGSVHGGVSGGTLVMRANCNDGTTNGTVYEIGTQLVATPVN